MSDHLYRTAPEVSHVSDIYSPPDYSQDPSVCVSSNLSLSNEAPDEFHSKSSDTPTRLQGFQLSFLTDVTQNFSCFLRTFLFTVIYELTECGINLEIRSLLECFFTVWTAAGLAVVPALIQTGLAEVVSTWSRDWISEHVQTYRALNLFSQ